MMVKKDIADGTVHKISTDLKQALSTDSTALDKWADLTPLARNEWNRATLKELS